jgi:CubicO group peptidase (beta-lactamase class C family)
MAGQFLAPATLPEGKERPVPTERALGAADNWAGRFGPGGGSLVPASPARNLVVIVITLSQPPS